jgi:hypothetical protein
MREGGREGGRGGRNVKWGKIWSEKINKFRVDFREL